MKHSGFLIGWVIGSLIVTFFTRNLRAYAGVLILGFMIWLVLEMITAKKNKKNKKK